MEPAGLILFSSALFIAAASPGPGIAAIVARVLGRGPKGAAALSAGIVLGDLVWLTFAVLGLAALAQTFHGVFLAVKYAGAVYLLYLAYKLWTAPVSAQEVKADEKAEHPAKLLLGGLALTLGNPKAIVFYLALLPTFLDLTRITVLGYLELALATMLVLTVVFGGYILLAVRARRLFTTPSAIRILNRFTGTVMAGAAAAVAAR
ncbi:LysE family translocator [Microvirga guangxiensis]|jgi:threonine/homoserine/homoserine lactone efflux protein|uniref:Threonine/homoserine/homoserine lactone efflux protein n=1 Tax=Microvirga guangxiensis TaxID=549386 RepID=A0A1G5GHB0_9HYPH|nr:LysE family translocator [Microvirga guangxiensis]SCY50699.1 Threonine/homoserine/homoserine lactone efflux protein [Microvirga guangxiensis]